MTELVLIRHGETDSNVRGTYLGWVDSPLNENGISQAKTAGNKLKNEKFDACFSSPLVRAYKTAEIILEGKNLPVHTDDRLKERNFGIWDDLTFLEISQKYPEEHKKWLQDINNYEIEGGESFSHSYNRTVEFADFILKNFSGKRILIVTHTGCIRNIFAYLTGLGMNGIWRFKIDNATINRLEINDEGYAYIKALNA
jgi:alpha-ribazole phosphatase